MNFLQSMVEGKGDKAVPKGQGLGMAVKAEVPVQLLQSPSLQREKANSLDTLTGNSLRSHYYSYCQSSEKSITFWSTQGHFPGRGTTMEAEQDPLVCPPP